MKSCIYEGQVRHSRSSPVHHEFQYRLFMMYIDLDELPSLFRRHWFWSADKAAPARFRRSDHLGSADEPLGECVRDLVADETGYRPQGPIRLLTNLAYFGHCFNPVSFYYCFSSTGDSVDYIVAEVSNTPWGERECYVMTCGEAGGASGPWRFKPEKKFHVSPFMSMDVEYSWLLSLPADRLNVHMSSKTDGERNFAASMQLGRRPINSRSLAGVLVRFPFMTLKIMLAIYWQALRLWIKRCPIYAHPDKIKEVATP